MGHKVTVVLGGIILPREDYALQCKGCFVTYPKYWVLPTGP